MAKQPPPFLAILYHTVSNKSRRKPCISSATCCGISSDRRSGYHHCESDTTYGWWYTPAAMIYTLKRDDIPLLSQWINKKGTFGRQKFLFCWRRRWDLNPRDALTPYEISSHASSATWVLLHKFNGIIISQYFKKSREKRRFFISSLTFYNIYCIM